MYNTMRNVLYAVLESFGLLYGTALYCAFHAYVNLQGKQMHAS